MPGENVSADTLAAETIAMSGKATPAPWFWNHVGDDLNAEAEHGPPYYGSRGLLTASEGYNGDSLYADGKFIAHTRTAAPALAEAVLRRGKLLKDAAQMLRTLTVLDDDARVDALLARLDAEAGT